MNSNCWTSAVDSQSGRTYYYNSETGETSWSLPAPESHRLHPTLVSNAASITIQTLPPATLVQQACSMVEKMETINWDNNSGVSDRSCHVESLELETLTPGQLADLVYLQRECNVNNKEGVQKYNPIDPHQLPVNMERPPVEQTRLETRLNVLYKELSKIQ